MNTRIPHTDLSEILESKSSPETIAALLNEMENSLSNSPKHPVKAKHEQASTTAKPDAIGRGKAIFNVATASSKAGTGCIVSRKGNAPQACPSGPFPCCLISDCDKLKCCLVQRFAKRMLGSQGHLQKRPFATSLLLSCKGAI
jgi:hypothetical protein